MGNITVWHYTGDIYISMSESIWIECWRRLWLVFFDEQSNELSVTPAAANRYRPGDSGPLLMGVSGPQPLVDLASQRRELNMVAVLRSLEVEN